MLCCVIRGPTWSDAGQQIEEAKPHCDLLELRFDFFESLDLTSLRKLRGEHPFPMIFTLRPKDQGGEYAGSIEQRIAQIKKLAGLCPEYIDIEYNVPASLVKEVKEISPQTTIIVSAHDFEKMPDPLPLLERMEALGGDLYKMAFQLHSSSEALSLLLFMQQHYEKVIAMGMGPYGEATRILAPLFGGKITYGSVSDKTATAPGQLSVSTLTNTYDRQATTIYGLIGDPVTYSPSHITHNAIMKSLHLPSVYVKFPVPKQHLSSFLDLTKKTPIRGMSVTMPLKEEIIPLLDEVDPWAKKVGAVNTLRFHDGKITGFNTDGKGALDAIETKGRVKGKHVVFLGAGGAARAVIAEAIRRGAKVTILNRTPQKAKALAKEMGCTGGALEELSEVSLSGYDILINATPDQLPIDPEWIIPGTIAMDMKNRPKETLFLQHAAKKHCTLVYGYEMFINQAIEQYRIWFEDEIDLEKVKETLEQTVLKVVSKVE